MIDFSDTKRAQYPIQAPLTALIDMVFMLLIYFLLTMGFMVDEGIGIKLPEAGQASRTMPRDLVVAVTQEGTFFWEGTQVSLFELEQKLTAIPGLTTDTRIVIRADRGTRVNSVVQIMDLAKTVGAASFCLATEDESGI
ncbi:biopolymer transporter ExbD [Desulfoluna sp.]|uniref:ExbD/TolR family protein n=1 Tax=Desulfoluna sp. TaxID=2045199 RepID=UPI002613CC9F|nr:biopolymer transporter ExbD [Desulfoluna sp.]